MDVFSVRLFMYYKMVCAGLRVSIPLVICIMEYVFNVIQRVKHAQEQVQTIVSNANNYTT